MVGLGKVGMEGRLLQNPNGFGTDNRLVTIFYIQLAVDGRQVSFDGLGRDKQAFGDVIVGHSLGKHPQHLDFTVCQRFNQRLVW